MSNPIYRPTTVPSYVPHPQGFFTLSCYCTRSAGEEQEARKMSALAQRAGEITTSKLAFFRHRLLARVGAMAPGRINVFEVAAG